MAEALKIGDCVEVFGLASESGSALNAQRGILTKFIDAKGRFEVRLSPDRVCSIKPENLKKVELTVAERLRVLGLGGDKSSDEGTAADRRQSSRSRSREKPQGKPENKEEPELPDLPFKPGHCVEVFGMESEKGKRLNGQSGIVVRYLVESKRFEIRFIPDYIVSVKADNLRKMEFNFNAAAGAGDASGAADGKAKSRSSSSSSSSRSRSRSRSKSKVKDAENLKVDDVVKIFGLESAQGSLLNGQSGPIVSYIEDTGRYEVRVAPDKTVNVKPANLKKQDASSATPPAPSQECAPAATKNESTSEPPKPPVEPPKKEVKKPELSSLSSLLGLGRVEEAPKKEEWTSVWSRSGGGKVASVKLSQEEIDTFQSLVDVGDQAADELKELRKQVEDEFRAAGCFDEGMVEQIYQERLKDFQMMKALRPQGMGPAQSSPKVEKERRDDDGSHSSSSSSSSSSRSHEEKSKDDDGGKE